MSLTGGPRDHMNALLGILLPFARDAIAEHGTFFPIGATMSPDGELQAAGGDARGADPTADALLDSIRGGFRSRADLGELIATGVATDVTIPQGEFPLGIRIELEHRDGDPITCVVPYRETTAGAFEYGDIVAFEGNRLTWHKPDVDRSSDQAQ
jgi:hypothetical protein